MYYTIYKITNILDIILKKMLNYNLMKLNKKEKILLKESVINKGEKILILENQDQNKWKEQGYYKGRI